MANPATSLASLIESWTVEPGKRVIHSRQVGAGHARLDTIEGWRDTAIGARLLGEVEEALDSLEATGQDVSHFRETMPAWYNAVFRPDESWNADHRNMSPGINASDLRVLKALGNLLDTSGLKVPAGTVDAIVQQLEMVEKAVADSPDLPSDLRIRVVGLIRKARRAVEDIDLGGETAVVSAAQELGAELVIIMGDTRVEEVTRSRFKDLIGPFFTTVSATIGLHVGNALFAGGEDVLKQITK